jgi:hypothetical protein
VFVRDAVEVIVGVLVEVPTVVMVGDEVRAVEEPVGVADKVDAMVLVSKTPIGMIIAGPVETARGVRIESLHTGGVNIS